MKVLVLQGGPSGEHEISLVSAASVTQALLASGHDVFSLTLGRDDGARWDTSEGSVMAGLDAAIAWGAEVAFIAMHGAYGEDGCMQGALELAGLPVVLEAERRSKELLPIDRQAQWVD